MAMTPEQVREQMDRATALYKDRQWQEAINLFAELATEPEGVSGANEMHWNMAMCFAHLGDMDLAHQHVQASGFSTADFDRDFARSKHELGVALYNEQRWDEAANAWAELLILPGFPSSGTDEAHWNIAMCFAQMGDFDKAFGHIRAGGQSEAEFREKLAAAGLTPPEVE